MRRAPAACSIVIAAGIALGAASQDKPQLAPQRFDARAEVVLVDVSVLDRDGRPVEGLAAADFDLIVNGQPRAIQNIQYISALATNSVTETTARERQFTSNDAKSSGRLFLFAVDEDHLRFGANRAVLDTAGRLLDKLAPGDLVALARLPDGTGGVEFTTDRLRVRRALERVVGRQPSRRLDPLRVSEAWAFDNRDRFTWERVLERECGPPPSGSQAANFAYQSCVLEQEAFAKQIIVEASGRAQHSIRVLEQLMAQLAAMRAPITMVLISEGMFLGRDRSDLTLFARRAAEARVTLHTVQPAESMFDSDKPEALGGGIRDEDLLGESMSVMAGQTGGTHYKINISSGAGAFERIRREISGYYLLAFEPTDLDRTSRDRRIKVEVKRSGVTVRARSTYALADTATTAAAAVSREQQLLQMLIAPLPASGLPIRVATYSVTHTQDTKVRVVLAAEIGEAAHDEVEWPIGLLVVDKDNKFIVNTVGPFKLAPASPRSESPRLLLNAFVVDPGEYTLRLAAVAPDGRSGSVHHIIDARLQPVGSASRISDLILSAPLASSTDAPRPTPSNVIDSEALTAMLEMTGRDPQRLARARVRMEVADSETGPALISMPAQQATRGDGTQHAFAATLKLGLVPAGEYVARAVVSIPGEPDTRVTRAFRAMPPAIDSAPVVSAPRADPDAAPVPPPPSRIVAPVLHFSADEVLKPEVVNVFLDALQQRQPVSAASAAIVAQARKGVFAAPPAGTPAEDEATLAFIRGLEALQKKTDRTGRRMVSARAQSRL